MHAWLGGQISKKGGGSYTKRNHRERWDVGRSKSRGMAWENRPLRSGCERGSLEDVGGGIQHMGTTLGHPKRTTLKPTHESFNHKKFLSSLYTRADIDWAANRII